MNFGSIAKVLLIGGGITTVGALPNIVSSSSDNFSSNKRTRRSTSLNQEGIIAKGGKFGVKNYCFYYSPTGIVGVLGDPKGPDSKGSFCENNYEYHIGRHHNKHPRIEYKWEDEKYSEKPVLLVSGSKGLMNSSETRDIIGCFDKQWWGKSWVNIKWRVGSSLKVGRGYNGGSKPIRYYKNNILQNGGCSNGTYESTANIVDLKTTYKDSENSDQKWEIKYFGDLTWTLER